ncbi:MAG: hypothetical protein K9J17_07640 [Flavobacteriales bacterium]|nr:hypothetical protein [Flavobacteriales bacterium]
MKSKYLLFAMLVGVAVSTTACKKCQTCTYQGGSEVEICRDDYGTPQLYDAYIRSLETQGYTCK